MRTIRLAPGFAEIWEESQPRQAAINDTLARRLEPLRLSF